MKQLIPGDDASNKAALILATMSPDMVNDIARLVNTQGKNLIPLVFGTSSTTTICPLAMFSRSYIDDDDFPEVWLGMMTIILSHLRKPSWGNDEYEAILKTAFGIPNEMAAALAAKIETRDLFSQAQKDAAWYKSLANSISEGTRRSLNWAATLLNTGWEIDQTQDYDIDFLYELKHLGATVDDLTSRGRLMRGQALINNNMNMLPNAGDIEEGDVDDFESAMGDALGTLTLRNLPRSIFGSATPIVAAATKSAANTVESAKEAEKTAASPEKRSVIQGVMNKILTLKPGKAILLGAGIGLAPALLKGLLSVVKGQRGDVDQDLYGDIEEEFGTPIAEAWANNDIEGIVEQALGDAFEEASTGDQNTDETLIGDAIASVLDEGTDADSEVGGILTRWRANRNIRRANRRVRKSRKRGARAHYRAERAQRLIDAKRMANDAGYDRVEEMAEGPGYPQMNDDGQQEEEVNYNLDQYDWGGGIE